MKSELGKAILTSLALCASIVAIGLWKDLDAGSIAIYVIIIGMLMPAFAFVLRSGRAR